MSQENKKLEASYKDSLQEISTRESQIEELIQRLDQMNNKLIHAESLVAERTEELKGFKEKASDLEQQLDEIRKQNEENNNLGVVSALQAADKSAHQFDLELKKTKEHYSYQITQLKEEANRYRQKNTDL